MTAVPPDRAESLVEPVFLRTCRGLAAERVPVWFMRQAGRSLPEYRAARGSGSILEAIGRPELAAELTVQPVRRYGVDAAILFSDIVVPAAAVGFGIDVEPGVGPVVAEPFRSESDLERLRPAEPEVDFAPVTETVRLVVAELGPDVPLIGFAGGPFTVASYLIEGGPSRHYLRTKALMHQDPGLWVRLLDRLADLAVASLRSQIRAGAAAVQLFDSWAGALSPGDYERFVLPASTKVLQGVADLEVPRIHFGVGTGELLELMGRAGAEVVGIDWRVPLDRARARIGPDHAVQGNLDPALCLAGWEATEAEARDVLRRGGGTGHIFNLGHGVLPETDPDVLTRLVELVHSAPAPGPPGPLIGRTHAGPTPPVTPVGVLVMAHGTPATLDDLPDFYTEIRRGRPPSQGQLADLRRRYEAIGGTSPLNERTRDQVAQIQRALDRRRPGRFVVALGMKFAPPRIEDAVADLRRRGVDRIIGVVLAPHSSVVSVGDYERRAATAAGAVMAGATAGGDAGEGVGPPAGSGPVLSVVDHWYDEPGFARLVAGQVTDALATLPPTARHGAVVLFTAHSLPQRAFVDEGDTYPDQGSSATAAAVHKPDSSSGTWPGRAPGARPSPGSAPTWVR